MAQKGKSKNGKKMLDQLIKGLVKLQNEGFVCESIELSNESREAYPSDPEFDDKFCVRIPTGKSHYQFTLINPKKLR